MISSNDGKVRQWYVAYTAPRAEKKIAERLKEKNIEYYLPLKKTYKYWSDRRKWVEEPLFSSYIFVNVSNKEYFDAINVSGMVSYVRFGGKAATLSSETICQIKQIAESNLMTEVLDEVPCCGKQYKIKSGPLKGIEGTVVRMQGKRHFVLEIKEMGKVLILPYVKE